MPVEGTSNGMCLTLGKVIKYLQSNFKDLHLPIQVACQLYSPQLTVHFLQLETSGF